MTKKQKQHTTKISQTLSKFRSVALFTGILLLSLVSQTFSQDIIRSKLSVKEEQIKATQLEIQQLEETMKMLKEKLSSEQMLFEEGLIPKTVVEETKKKLANQQILLDKAKATRADQLKAPRFSSPPEDQ